MVRRIRNEAVKREIEESDFISNKEKEIIMNIFDKFNIVIIKHYMKDEMFDGSLYHALVIETNDMSKKALNNLERGLRQLEKKYDIGYEKNYNSNGDNAGTYYFYKYINDYISEDATDDVLRDKTFKIPDVPSDYLYDIIEYGKSIGIKENQFDYDDDTETLTITYSPYSGLEFDKCRRVQNMFARLYNDENEDFDECYKTESLSDKKNGEYLHYIVKITPYKNMFKFDLDNQHFDKQSYCFFDKNGKYVDTNYKSVSEKEFNKFYDKSMKPNKAYGFYYTKPFGEFLGFEEVPLRWFGA